MTVVMLATVERHDTEQREHEERELERMGEGDKRGKYLEER
jgi:hypothetical protein